ncbi:MAG: NAD(P)-dependent oxidoreductase [Candidatus Liptonbacteria bacterium]|nr:NAD(P)-dependent oxidoreductase [Candidatus Liptonbacteria bacterium]
MAKILIPGGAGFIGYHLAKKLAEVGHEVAIADLRTQKDAGFASLLSLPRIKIIEADLTDRSSWNKLGGGYDFVYHLVSINGFRQFNEIPHEVLRIGIMSILNALEWFRSENGKPRAKLLYTSSNELYIGALGAFNMLPLPTPETVPGVVPDPHDPRWSYGGHKLINELLLIHYAKAYGLRMVIVRPHYIYGPRAGYEPMIPKMIERIKNHIEPFPLIGGDDSRSYCYIDDTVDGLIAAMEFPTTDGNTYNIGSSERITIKTLTETLFSLMNWRPERLEMKNSPDGKTNHFLPDVSKLRRDAGWKTKVPLGEGLEKTIAWYLANPK